MSTSSSSSPSGQAGRARLLPTSSQPERGAAASTSTRNTGSAAPLEPSRRPSSPSSSASSTQTGRRVFTPLSSCSDDDERIVDDTTDMNADTGSGSAAKIAIAASSSRTTDQRTSSQTSTSRPSSKPTTSSMLPPHPAPKARIASSSPSRQPAHVYAVLLVAFDHLQGPVIEFGYPPQFGNDPYLNSNLPFLALPDGAHAREEDYSYFHMLNPAIAPGTIFGISCNRQIQADELLKKGKDVTRSTVQKAIVVLASKPIFGPLRDKLGVITRTFFAQRNFDDKSILVDLYSSFESPPSPSSSPRLSEAEQEEREDAGMYMGTSLRELVYRFRSKTLMLLKLLMLQRKVMFYAANTPVEALCTMQYSLVALIPALLTHLDDAASPLLDVRSQNTTRSTSLRTSDKSSLVRYLGLPLNIFGMGAFFQPYLPLQQIDLLQAHSFLVGTTNSIFQQQRDSPIDVLVRLESAQLEVHDPRLSHLISLTAADRKWMDEIVSTVDNSYNVNDPATPVGMNFIGSEDFLRAKFEEYICSLLACIKFTDFLKKGDRAQMLLSGNELASYNVESFNEAFVRAFKQTSAFAVWNRTTDDAIFDLVEPKHPMEGKTNPIEDVGIRLAHGLHDLHLPENLGPTREAISRGVQQGSESIWGAYSFLRSDLSKRQKEFTERRSTSNSAPGTPLGLDVAGNTLLAGVDVAKTGVATVATGIGSFLASRRMSGLFSGGPHKTPPDSRADSPLAGASRMATSPPPPLELKNAGLKPSLASTSPPGTSPLPSPSSGSSNYLRPLSTAPLATTPPLSPAAAGPATNTATTSSSSSGGFFASVNPLTSLLRGRSPEPPPTITSNLTTSDRPVPPKELELGQELMPRDLDKEFAAKEARIERRRSTMTVAPVNIIPVQLPEGELNERRMKQLEEMTDDELTAAGIPGATTALSEEDIPGAPKVGGGEFE